MVDRRQGVNGTEKGLALIDYIRTPTLAKSKPKMVTCTMYITLHV